MIISREPDIIIETKTVVNNFARRSSTLSKALIF
jgi:hypothetical protein